MKTSQKEVLTPNNPEQSKEISTEVLNRKAQNTNGNFQVFESEDFGKVRSAMVDGNPYFVAMDVAKALGYTNPREALHKHCRGVTKRDTPTTSGIQSLNYLSEPDLYRLVMRSRLPSAEKFADWVFEEVLPSLRKTGQYAIPAQVNTAESMDEQHIKFLHEMIKSSSQVIALKKEFRRMEAMGADPKQLKIWYEEKIDLLLDTPDFLMSIARECAAKNVGRGHQMPMTGVRSYEPQSPRIDNISESIDSMKSDLSVMKKVMRQENEIEELKQKLVEASERNKQELAEAAERKKQELAEKDKEMTELTHELNSARLNAGIDLFIVKERKNKQLAKKDQKIAELMKANGRGSELPCLDEPAPGWRWVNDPYELQTIKFFADSLAMVTSQKVTEARFYKWLRDHGYLYDTEEKWNLPKERYLGNMFEIKKTRARTKTMITYSGREHIVDIFPDNLFEKRVLVPSKP